MKGKNDCAWDWGTKKCGQKQIRNKVREALDIMDDILEARIIGRGVENSKRSLILKVKERNFWLEIFKEKKHVYEY